MPGNRIDGIEVAKQVKDRLKQATDELKSNDGIEPCLATVLVGDSTASATYVKNKHKACQEVGITTRDHTLPSSFSQEEMYSLIDQLNQDSQVHAILVQLPLPEQIDEYSTTNKILPLKDADGLTSYNMGLLSVGKALLKPCTPSGIMEMFDYYNIDLSGKDVVVVNRSNLVGKPLYHMLIQRDATVTTCHSKTKSLEKHCQRADIVISGVGDRSKFLLSPNMIKDGSVVIDVGINRDSNGKLIGDANFDEIIQKASYASPVPGGVGPMTVAMLLKNTIMAASLSKQIGKNK